jgi:hypothetical protein
MSSASVAIFSTNTLRPRGMSTGLAASFSIFRAAHPHNLSLYFNSISVTRITIGEFQLVEESRSIEPTAVANFP